MVHEGTYNYSETTQEIKKWVCDCGKQYKYHSGFYRHRKICEAVETQIVETGSTAFELKNMFINVVEENKELRRLLMKQQEQIGEIIPRIGHTTNHTTNNTFNLQVFLQEHCKDALNITDFIESLDIQIKDLEHTKKYGLCEGVANIFVNGLKQLGTYKRPIHCTDMKRETLYIKDNNEWEKEEDGKNKLKRSLYDLADKQRKAIKDWEESHPEWEKTDQGKEEWILIVKNVMGTITDDNFSENKIIRKVAREVKI